MKQLDSQGSNVLNPPPFLIRNITPLNRPGEANVLALADLRIADCALLRRCRLIRLPDGDRELVGPQLRLHDPETDRTHFWTASWWPSAWGRAFASALTDAMNSMDCLDQGRGEE